MKKIFPLLLLTVILNSAAAQNYVYATISAGTGTIPGNTVTATGSFGSPAVVSPFSIAINTSLNKISSFSNSLGGVDELPEVNSWESKYGNIDPSNTRCIKVRHAGNFSFVGALLGTPIVTTLTFNTVTPTTGWGFLVMDIDVDEVDIRAKDPSGAYYSNAQVSSWFKDAFDANTADGESSLPGLAEPPCYSSLTATVVGSEHNLLPCLKIVELMSGTDHSGAGAWFEPDLPVKELEFTLYNLQANTATISQRYFIAAASITTVPVILSSFTAAKSGTSALLKWTTAQEISSKSFEIERSSDGVSFTSIGIKEAAGNSFNVHQYSMNDEHPSSGINYYRLKSTNIDGSYTYSEVKAVSFFPDDNILIFPNPARENLTIIFGEKRAGQTMNVSMLNGAGQVVLTKMIKNAASLQLVTLPKLPAGLYYVKITDRFGISKMLKVQIQ